MSRIRARKRRSWRKGCRASRRKTIPYRNMTLREFDLDAALSRKPQLILVDELAHTNAEGVRNRKRYQDVEELLNAGIDVFTTVNVQHIESLNDIVENITKVKVLETVPDAIIERADKIKLVDVEPDELLRRFDAGKVYRPEQAERARRNFFAIENLRLLREIALRKAADRIGSDNQTGRAAEKMANTKLLVCFGPSPSSARCIRWTARAAEAFHAQWTALYVETQDSEYFTKEQQAVLRANMDLAAKLGAEIVTISGMDIAISVAEYARLSGITNIVVGKSRRHSVIHKLFSEDFEDRLIGLLPSIEVHIVPDPARAAHHRRFIASQAARAHAHYRFGYRQIAWNPARGHVSLHFAPPRAHRRSEHHHGVHPQRARDFPRNAGVSLRRGIVRIKRAAV